MPAYATNQIEDVKAGAIDTENVESETAGDKILKDFMYKNSFTINADDEKN